MCGHNMFHFVFLFFARFALPHGLFVPCTSKHKKGQRVWVSVLLFCVRLCVCVCVMAIMRSVTAAFGVPLLTGLCWTAFTSRGVRNVVVKNPLDVSPYCRDMEKRTKREGVSCLMCAFEVPVTVPTANIRNAIASHTMNGSVYAMYALVSSFIMRVEVTATAFMLRWRLSDAYQCLNSTRRCVLAHQSCAVPLQDESRIQSFGGWEMRVLEGDSGASGEAVMTYGPEAIVTSLSTDGEGPRQMLLHLCYILQPFDSFEKDSVAEKVALWCAEMYGILLIVQTKNAMASI